MRLPPIWRVIPVRSRQAFKWDALSGFLTGVFFGAVFPFLGVIARRDLGASAFMIAALTAAWSVGNLFNPITAHFIRGRVKLPYVVWPSTLGRASYALMALALVAPSFVAICVVAAVITAQSSPAYAAVIRDAYPVERRGTLMGMVRVLMVGGTIIGALAGGFALDRISYRYVFPAFAIVGVLGTLAFSRIGVRAEPEDSETAPARFGDGFRALATDRRFRLYAACFFLYGLGNLLMMPVIPVFQVDVLDISTRWVSYLATSASVLGMIGYLFWGRYLDRHGPFRLLLSVIAVATIAPITYYLAQEVPVLVIAAAAQGLAGAGGELGYINAAMRFGPREAVVSYAGLFAFLQAVRGIPGPFVGAALSNALGPRPVFLIALGCWALSVTILLVGGGLRAEMRGDGRAG